MERCAKCSRTSEEVRLFDGIYVNDSVRICERCALISNIPIIKRPSTEQLKDSEKTYGVRSLLMKMNHLDNSNKKDESVFNRIKELESKPELEQPEDLVFKLIDNFHWTIQTERRRKGLSTKQLADSIGESESAIKLLEKGIVPNKALNLITAVEQFLKIRIIKKDFLNSMKMDSEPKTSNIIFRKSSVQTNPPQEVKSTNNLRQEQAEEMVREAILEEKSPAMKKIERDGKYPFSINEFQKNENRVGMVELKQRNEQIEKDFTKKSSGQIGKEQVENFGKEDTNRLKRTIFKEKPKNSVPTIYELMKKKEESDKMKLTGKGIDLA